ncbi:hypothetical protein ISS22_18675 [candidate division KSB1 bacterium]|nr:hypothetical protein [candidate division KSB1 bacterium]
MQQMHFDFRDIFRSTRLALSLQRIWIQFVGLFFGYLGYLVLTYVSFITSGIGLSVGWNKYGLLPCLISESPNWYSMIIYFIGVFWLVAVYLVTATAVSRATYMLAKGNNFYTWKESFSFAVKKAGAILMSPIALAIIIGLFVLGGAVVGWISKIPYVGELGLTIFTVIWFVASLVIVFLALVFGVSLLLAPAIIATTDDDAFEAVFQSFSTLWSQPWRLVLYEMLADAMAIIGFVVLAFLSKKAFIVMDRIFSSTMGADFMNISAHGMYLLSVWVAHSIDWINSICPDMSNAIYFSREFDPLALPGYQIAASYIFAIMILLIGSFIVSYGLASFNVGNTLTYLILRKKKDDENLLERKDREEEEEDEEDEEESSESDEKDENKDEEK